MYLATFKSTQWERLTKEADSGQQAQQPQGKGGS
jgi:hypothetical protein